MKMSQVIWKMIPDKVSAALATFRILRSISEIRKKENDVSEEDSSNFKISKKFSFSTIFGKKSSQKIAKN